ncbi:inactive hydroxysteroid dehydrogenase-like protein 1 [Chanos chanos]|uniref:Inactive hydroxysteroid dehydrogenase-like protein 1 n=1 Tax=Chanos chanos TaxID=29144 RepID=A0A6J2V7S7_CHACN|nr:inactive hydroxysteroid dehydrogenase-like protein 1 [Chanos chanos]
MAAVDSFHLLYREMYREIARSCDCYVETLAVVGALYTATKAIVFIRDCCCLLRHHFIPRLVHHRDLVQQYGQWAIVCGALEPIAKAYAKELAARGVCIILLSPDMSSASDVSKSVSEAYGVEVIVVEADFSLGHAVSKSVTDIIKDKDIGFIINSLDVSLFSSQCFSGLCESRLWDSVSRDLVGATLVTRLALPGMTARRRGAVVNISSGTHWRPSPAGATLSASTAYLDSFSWALHYEYGPQGIFVQSLLPCGVVCPGPEDPDRAEGGSWLVPHVQVYARHALSTLGVTRRTTGYWPHTIQFGLVRSLPDWAWVLAWRVFSRT